MSCMTSMRARFTGPKIIQTGLFCLALLSVTALQGQDPQRFEEEVNTLSKQREAHWNPYRPTVLFTGSSSIRLWNGLDTAFPGVQVVNTGFGGSQASDLGYFLQPLVLAYNPLKVFIYEGDNDLAEGKSAGRALRDMRAVVSGIRARYPGMPVVLIAAKPSISRWKLRDRYRKFNRKLARWAASDPLVEFADVWTPMLLTDGKLNSALFIEDGLHMNTEGYRIWQQVLAPLIPTNP